MKPGEPGYRGPETEDEFLAEVEALPAPLVLESVSRRRASKRPLERTATAAELAEDRLRALAAAEAFGPVLATLADYRRMLVRTQTMPEVSSRELVYGKESDHD